MKKILNEFLIGLLFTLVFIFIFSHNAEAVIPVTVTATPTSIDSGRYSTITWSSTGATSCSLLNDITGIAVANGTSGTYTTPPLYVTTSYTVNCVSSSPACDYYPLTTTACFVADTVVLMANGSAKNIQEVKIGDVLKGEKTNNKVLGLHQPELSGKLYSLNGGRYFVTEEHPFKTTDGWKSINPNKTREENLGITVTELKVGDTLLTDKGKVLLKTINGKVGKRDTDLFNFILDGDHTYYADGYLVHNKIACDMTMPDGGCPTGEICISLANGKPITPAYPLGSCAVCPRTCNAGFINVCNGDVTTCIESSGCPATLGCQGTVAGSQYYNGPTLIQPGPYEGDPCSQFTTFDTCQQGMVTHGCTWAGAPFGYAPLPID